MGPIPENLIVFLFIAAFALVEVLRRLRGSVSQRGEVEPIAATAADDDLLSETETETETATPAQVPWTPVQVAGPRPKPVVQAGPALLPVRPHGRRYSRRRLMGDRRSLQEAVVIATILGPCLAHRAHGTE